MKPTQLLSLLFVFLLMLGVAPASRAQNWSGIIDSSRAIDWSHAGIAAGIPNRSTICATLNPGVTSSQINSAIQSCPSGQVVFLNAGTYNLSAGVSFLGKSNVTLRGAGPTKTILQFSGGDRCGGQGGNVCIIDANPFYVGSPAVNPGGSNSRNWTGGYAKGSTTITLDNASGLAVGSVIILDQANDNSDNGSVFICDASSCHQSTEASSPNGRTINGNDYNQTQIVTVTGISGTQVSISPGLYMSNWRASQSPGVWWTGQVTGDGVENLTVDSSNDGDSVTAGIYFYDANNCWVKNIRSIRGNRNHVWLYQSSRNVVRDSYFFGTQNGAQESYGVESFIASDNLIENNIFDQIASPVMSSGSSGSVHAYNYSINNLYNISPAWMQNSYANHDAGNLLNLFEGNQFNALDCDDIHGTGALATYFRNQLSGSQSAKNLNTHAVNIYSYCRAYNIVGNVLGTPGYHTSYEVSVASSSGTCDLAIYDLGWSGSECGVAPGPPNDPLVEKTLLRWGNYDTVTGTARFLGSEVPSAIGNYSNAVPPNQNLPTSFYMSSRPAWWGAMPWPAIGPDVAGGTITSVGGHAFAIPAQVCYNTTSQSSGILNFDANACYSVSASAPNPPTNVKAVAQ
jgi:hypothetical protein